MAWHLFQPDASLPLDELLLRRRAGFEDFWRNLAEATRRNLDLREDSLSKRAVLALRARLAAGEEISLGRCKAEPLVLFCIIQQGWPSSPDAAAPIVIRAHPETAERFWEGTLARLDRLERDRFMRMRRFHRQRRI